MSSAVCCLRRHDWVGAGVQQQLDNPTLPFDGGEQCSPIVLVGKIGIGARLKQRSDDGAVASAIAFSSGVFQTIDGVETRGRGARVQCPCDCGACGEMAVAFGGRDGHVGAALDEERNVDVATATAQYKAVAREGPSECRCLRQRPAESSHRMTPRFVDGERCSSSAAPVESARPMLSKHRVAVLEHGLEEATTSALAPLAEDALTRVGGVRSRPSVAGGHVQPTAKT